MEAQLAQFTNIGMFQDTSISKASNEFAFENYNIRITAVDGRTLLSVTNERMPKELSVSITGQSKTPNRLSFRKASSSSTIFELEYPAEESIAFTINSTSTYGINKGDRHVIIENIDPSNISSITIVSPVNGVGSRYTYYYNTLPTDISLNYIPGNYLGHTIINDTLVLFTKDTSTSNDYIITMSLNLNANGLVGSIKFAGNLNFSISHSIEAIPFYESEDVQKVYWVDGYNPPRFLNIQKAYSNSEGSSQFEFSPKLDIFPTVKVSKDYRDGKFPAGTIQYFISYYNKFGTETGIVWASDLQYMTQSGIAESPEGTTTCSFSIDISNIDTSFEYIRVYSLQRTSLNNVPIANIVFDSKISGSNMRIIDTNDNIESIDPTSLYFKGGNDFIASTISQKDNTVFFGNVSTSEHVISSRIKNLISGYRNSSGGMINFSYKSINVINDKYQLDHSESAIKTFKCRETYRFALQFQSEKGTWSQPVWIGDYLCNMTPKISSSTISVPSAVFNMSYYSDLKNALTDEGYVNYRLLMAEVSDSDRSILAQGFVNPTVFNHADRVNNSGPYAIASWITRPMKGSAHYEHLSCLGNNATYDRTTKTTSYSNTSTAEIQNSINAFPLKELSSAPTRVPTVLVVASIRVINNSQMELLIVKTDYTKKNEPLAILTSNMLLVLHREILEVGSGADPYNYKVFSEVVSEYINNNDTSLMPGLTKDQYTNYLNSLASYSGDHAFIGDTKWVTGYFTESNLTFTKNKNTSSIGGLYYIGTGTSLVTSSSSSSSSSFSNLDSQYFVDSSILTFHSPDIENNQSLITNSKLNFRIIGIATIDNTISDIILHTDGVGAYKSAGLYRGTINNRSGVQLFNRGLYKDYAWEGSKLSNDSITTYYIYLWHKSGSIIGQTADSLDSSGNPLTTTYAELKHKVMSNHNISNNNTYFTNSITYKGIYPTVFNSDSVESKMIKLYNGNYIYQGNYDRLVASTSPYKVMYSVPTEAPDRPSNMRPGSMGSSSSSSQRPTRANTYADFDQYDPVRIKYNITPHIVFELRNEDYIHILPYLSSNEESAWSIFSLYPGYSTSNNYAYPWYDEIDKDFADIYKQNSISGINSKNPNTGYHLSYVFLGEIYRDIDSDLLYGGSDDNALERVKWIPASDITSISKNITNSYGDTYFQRWDCLLSYPSTEEDINSVVDVTSIMVETHYNIEGRYDKNKNIENTLNARRSNFNKINNAYSQNNNFFTYNILDSKFNQTSYESQVVFSMPKEPSSDIDPWTSISLVNAINLNGIYGKLNKLINFNNNIIAFQDRAVSTINYNNKTAISTESGVPIEIANSGKANGYSVLSDSFGCQNKQSICKASSGLYFIDDLNKSMYMFNKDGVTNMSTSKGMSVWFKNNLTGNEKLFYDALTHDVYLTNEDYCLSYNEDMQSFISFYDYAGINAVFNIGNESVILSPSESIVTPSIMFKGKYTTEYGMIYRINPEPLVDKIFTNVEFIADMYAANAPDVPYSLGTTADKLPPFNYLKVWNEYQEGIVDNTALKKKYPNFEKKFRVWRVDVPRDKNHRRDRIRNPWMMLELRRFNAPNNRMVFHNLLVKYFK